MFEYFKNKPFKYGAFTWCCLIIILTILYITVIRVNSKPDSIDSIDYKEHKDHITKVTVGIIKISTITITLSLGVITLSALLYDKVIMK